MGYDLRGTIMWIALVLLVATLIWCVHQWRVYRRADPPLAPAVARSGNGGAAGPAHEHTGRGLRLGIPVALACVLIAVLVWAYLQQPVSPP